MPECRPPAGELCGSLVEFASYHLRWTVHRCWTNHCVGSYWNHADNVGAVSQGATLSDQCLDGLCDSFRRAGLSVHEVTPAALCAETLGMRTIPSHGVLLTHRQACVSSQVGVARFDASSSCLRKGRATDCWSSLVWRQYLARCVVPFGTVYV